MVDGIIGTVSTTTLALESRLEGETFTISAATKPDGTAWVGPTITEVGSGTYSLAFTPDTAGVYLATIIGDTSGEVFSGSWEILAAATQTFTPRANGQKATATWWNDLQDAVDTLKSLNGVP